MGTKAITTITGKKKMLLARAGQQPLPKIAQMVFGSGGVNEGGEVLEPATGQKNLNDEIYRKDIDRYEIVSDTQIKYFCTLTEGELTGANINDLALADADGDLIAIQNFMTKGKDDDWEMVFEINDTM